VLLDGLLGIVGHLDLDRPRERLPVMGLDMPGVLLGGEGAVLATLGARRSEIGVDVVDAHAAIFALEALYEQHVVLDHVQEAVEVVGAARMRVQFVDELQRL